MFLMSLVAFFGHRIAISSYHCFSCVTHSSTPLAISFSQILSIFPYLDKKKIRTKREKGKQSNFNFKCLLGRFLCDKIRI